MFLIPFVSFKRYYLPLFFIYYILILVTRSVFKSTLLISLFNYPIFINLHYFGEKILLSKAFKLGNYYIGLSLTMFNLFVLLLTVLWFKKQYKEKVNIISKPAIIYSLLFAFSLLLSSLFTDKSKYLFLNTLNYLPIILLFVIAQTTNLNKNMKRIVTIIYANIILLESFIAIIQTYKQSTLGIVIEFFRIAELKTFGYFTHEGGKFFRAVGTFSHPTELAVLLSFSIPFLLHLSKNKTKKIRYYIYFSCLLSFIALLTTQARFAIIITSVILIITNIKEILNFYKNINKKVLFIFFILFLSISIKIGSIDRLLSSFQSVNPESSTLSSRTYLLKNSVKMIMSNPITGVGSGKFKKELISTAGTKSVNKFISEVHNLFLLLASEYGIPSALLFYFVILSKAKTYKKNKLISAGLSIFLLNSLMYNSGLNHILMGLLIVDLNTNEKN